MPCPGVPSMATELGPCSTLCIKALFESVRGRFDLQLEHSDSPRTTCVSNPFPPGPVISLIRQLQGCHRGLQQGSRHTASHHGVVRSAHRCHVRVSWVPECDSIARMRCVCLVKSKRTIISIRQCTKYGMRYKVCVWEVGVSASALQLASS